jgi:hypothetical protein
MLDLQIEIEDDPTPLVLGIAADVRRRLGDPVFAALTAESGGRAGVRVGLGPEAATVELGDAISIRHGLDSPDALAMLDRTERWDGSEIAGAAEHPAPARWLSALFTPPEGDWREAAATLWGVLAGTPGAPAGLLVTEAGTGAEERFGDPSGAYEIRAEAGALLTLLEGRSALMAEASAGSIEIRGSFAQISVISGALWPVRSGEAPNRA